MLDLCPRVKDIVKLTHTSISDGAGRAIRADDDGRDEISGQRCGTLTPELIGLKDFERFTIPRLRSIKANERFTFPRAFLGARGELELDVRSDYESQGTPGR